MDSTTITLLSHPYQLLLAAAVLAQAARAVFSVAARAHGNERIVAPQRQAA